MKKFSILIFALCCAASYATAKNNKMVEIAATQLSPQVFMLKAMGGNIGVLIGEDGTLMIDDQFEPLAPLIENKISEISNSTDSKVKYVVNTHFHGDHTGANQYFKKSASILAHENVRKRLADKNNQALPVVTYQQGIKLHLNGENVHVRHLASGHTDGDSVVYFEQANVWHLGDLFFNNMFPFVDLESGGSVQGYVANIKTLLTEINSESKIIPGHGELANKHDLETLLAMIEATKAEVIQLKKQGLTLDQIIARGLNSKWSAWSWSFITEKKWITTLYRSLES